MRTIKTIFTIILMLNAVLTFSQEAGEAKLEIKYRTADDKGPVQGEPITFKEQGSSVVVKVVTDVNGLAETILKQGNSYLVSVIVNGEVVKYDEPLSIPVAEGPIIMTYTLMEPVFTYTETFILNVHFETSKSTLTPESYAAIDEFKAMMDKTPSMVVEIAGHTDSQGSDASNLSLSKSRSNVVRNYLLKKGVEASRISAKGYGESEPIATNDTEAGRVENRRTEVRVIK